MLDTSKLSLMLFDMPTINYFVRSNNDKAQSTVLYCRVTFKGTKTEFSTRQKVERSKWDQSTQSYNGAVRLKKYLDDLMTATEYKIKSAALYGNFNTAKELVNSLKEKKAILLRDIVTSYIEKEKRTKAPGTIRNHTAKLKNLILFEKVSRTNYTPNTFTTQVAERFKDWYLIKNKTTNVGTANRNILFYSQAMRNAYKLGEIPSFDLMNFTGEKDPIKAPISLDESELEKLEKYPFVSMLSNVRDVFLFQCYTGLSFGDIWGDWEIEHTEHGAIITGVRSKRSNGKQSAYCVPVQNKVSDILDKHNQDLPRFENGTYNRLLKEIAALVGINKYLTSHTGRKTFASRMNALGWSRPSVADMLGHSSPRTTEKHYLTRSFDRVKQEMKKRTV